MANYTDSTLAEFLRHRRQRTQESNKKSIGMGTLRSTESAEMLAQFDAAIARLEQLARLSPLQQQFLDLVFCIEPAMPAREAKPAPAPVMFITGAQAEQITRLANHPLLSRPEKTTALLRINKLNKEEAEAFIAELAQRCHDLDNGVKTAPQSAPGVASTHPALAPSSYDQARATYASVLLHPRIKPEERDRAMAVIGDWTEAELQAKTKAVREEIGQREKSPTSSAVAA